MASGKWYIEVAPIIVYAAERPGHHRSTRRGGDDGEAGDANHPGRVPCGSRIHGIDYSA